MSAWARTEAACARFHPATDRLHVSELGLADPIVPHDPETIEVRDHLADELDLLARDLRQVHPEPAHVAVRPRQRLDESARDRIGLEVQPENRNRRRHTHRLADP
jgi:hypothetical protein